MVMKTSWKDANIKMLAIPENGLHHAYFFITAERKRKHITNQKFTEDREEKVKKNP